MTTPASGAAREIERLIEIVATLRGPDGCAWDREQTIDSLRPYVLEETYEVLEAIDEHDHRALCDELGDYLFEAIFVAQLETEAGHFSIADAAKAAAGKLVRRHPHVFARGPGQPTLESAREVRAQWEAIKARERGEQSKSPALLSGMPNGLPALLRASRIGARAASVGFDWMRPADVVAKIQEEVDEIREAVAHGLSHREQVEEEVGDLLFAIANLARKLGVEPESALRKANGKFTERFTSMEQRITQSGRLLSELPLEELEVEWEAVKRTETRL